MGESVLWKPMKVPDNSDFVAMIEMKKKGMFALLDSACKAPKPSPEQFVKEFVMKGIKTKTMLVWKESADDAHTFSIIGAEKTLDCQASDDHSRDIWVKGITKLLGQSEEDRQA